MWHRRRWHQGTCPAPVTEGMNTCRLGWAGASPPLLSAHGGPLAGTGAAHYAQIDIAATETAHRVGAQHAQTREERLSELEQRRRGAQQ